jgi:hypothetical protein
VVITYLILNGVTAVMYMGADFGGASFIVY